jgi:hypothetical protein
MAAFLVIGLTSILCAQGQTGALTGKVVDNEGNALPGVTVTVEGENYICDLIISAEVIDSQNLRVSQKGEPFSRTLSKKQLKDMIKKKVQIHKEWDFSLPPGKNLVYVSVTDSVRGKKLRKLFHAEGK